MSGSTDAPRWVGDALVIECQRWACKQKVGAQYNDGSGLCQACRGAGWIVLATKEAFQDEPR